VIVTVVLFLFPYFVGTSLLSCVCFSTLFVTQIAGETNTEVAIAGKQTVTTVQAVSI